MSTYATYEDFTFTYSLANIKQSQIESGWLPYGALRVNEELGGKFTTPFSSNNATARDLNVRFAYLGILLRTRNPDDSRELSDNLEKRITDICCGNAPMILDDGSAVFVTKETNFDAFSTTESYKSTFDMRDPEDQRVDTDYISLLWDQDNGV